MGSTKGAEGVVCNFRLDGMGMLFTPPEGEEVSNWAIQIFGEKHFSLRFYF